MNPDTRQMTLDGLIADPRDYQLVTIQHKKNRLTAVSVPPTFQTGQQRIFLARYVDGLELAVDSMHPSASPERISYLVERINFWKGVPEETGCGIEFE